MKQQKEISTTFHLLTRPTDKDIYAHIADQTGVPISAIASSELHQLRHFFVYDRRMPTRDPLIKKYIGHDGNATEKWQIVTQGTESLNKMFPVAMSYGLFSPSYYAELKRQKDRLVGQPFQHTSLLIGALTADTVREYATTVRDVYSDTDCQVIDIKGGKKAEALPEAVTFHIGNGLHLPFPDNSIDSVHTNFLLGHLKDWRHLTNHGRQKKLFKEVARVLDEDGVLLMIEEAVTSDVLSELRNTGFTDIEIKSTEMFIDRRAMESFLRSTAHMPLPSTTAEVDPSDVSFIVARKSAHKLR